MIEARVLALSCAYVPVAILSWQDAITAIFAGRAQVVENTDEMIKTGSDWFPLPSIIRFIKNKFIKLHSTATTARFNRRNVWLRDKKTCQYCGHGVALSDFTYEHVIPSSRGGKTSWENIVVACLPCNQKKGNRTPQEAGMKLLSQPKTPKGLFTKSMFPNGFKMPDNWRDWITSEMYWLVSLEET